MSKHTIFVAGSPEFVQTCGETTLKLGAKKELIHTEGFFAKQQPVVADAAHLLPA
ncbi:MAG: hypothetical protein M3R45_00310 [Pseudomonadota bacterium]|nr:hypothetical protein [Pseudomonadota bacterium]